MTVKTGITLTAEQREKIVKALREGQRFIRICIPSNLVSPMTRDERTKMLDQLQAASKLLDGEGE